MSAGTNEFTKKLKNFCEQKGVDLVGVADLKPAKEFLASHGDPIVTEFPRAISIGMRINDAIVDSHDPGEPRGKSLYWHHIYDVVSEFLNFVAYDVSRWLEDHGWDTLPVPASMPYNLKNLQGTISHKLTAHLAGLGWIGKNCLLLTPEFGPRVRFTTLLTDAPLSVGAQIDKKCGKCRTCIDVCPVNAFKNIEFNPSEDVDVRFDTAKCSEYRGKHPCGLCVSACPVGKIAEKRKKNLRKGSVMEAASMSRSRCPVCGCEQFYVKDPDDEYETFEFECLEGKACFAKGTIAAKCPEVREDTEVFCNACAWHDQFHKLK